MEALAVAVGFFLDAAFLLAVFLEAAAFLFVAGFFFGATFFAAFDLVTLGLAVGFLAREPFAPPAFGFAFVDLFETEDDARLSGFFFAVARFFVACFGLLFVLVLVVAIKFSCR